MTEEECLSIDGRRRNLGEFWRKVKEEEEERLDDVEKNEKRTKDMIQKKITKAQLECRIEGENSRGKLQWRKRKEVQLPRTHKGKKQFLCKSS